MKNNHLAKIEDLVLQIHNTDKMIALHAENPDRAFMLRQYQELKQRFFKALIQSLCKPPLSLPQQVYYIRLVSKKMSSHYTLKPNDSVNELGEIIAQM